MTQPIKTTDWKLWTDPQHVEGDPPRFKVTALVKCFAHHPFPLWDYEISAYGVVDKPIHCPVCNANMGIRQFVGWPRPREEFEPSDFNLGSK